MSVLHPQSLGETVNAISEAFLFGRKLPLAERRDAARWIAQHQGLPGAYAGMFAPDAGDDVRRGIPLFTGERATTAGARHILGQEACRALRLLKVRDRRVQAALDAATESAHRFVGPVGPRQPQPGRIDWLAPYAGGTYCCGRCSVALWRHVLAGGFDRTEERLAMGLRCLKACRESGSTTANFRAWRVFPMWYTLCALVEIELPAAVSELRHVAPQLERVVKSQPRDGCYAQRRHELATRAMAKC